jgi:hypothetical protein
VRFLWDYRPDLVGKKERMAAVTDLLAQNDLADLAIEDLRKWEVWEIRDKVLGLYDKKSHDVPIIRRAILRYAIDLSNHKGKDRDEVAKKWVDKRRKENAEAVKDAEELLKFDTKDTPSTASK